MNLLSITLKNIGPHADTTISIPDGFTAISAPNGSGKTFLLEAVFAALWGEFPSRPGSLYDYLTNSTGEISICFTLSERSESKGALSESKCAAPIYHARRTLKNTGKTQSQEALLWLDGNDGGQNKPLAGPKVTDFDAKITELIGDKRTFLASVFSAQNNAGDLCSAKPAERREVLGDLLNFKLYDEISEKARKAASKVESEISNMEQEIRRNSEKLDSLPALEVALAADRDLRDKFSDGIERDRAALDSVRQESANLKAANDQVDAIKNEITEIQKEESRLDAQRERITAEINRAKERIAKLPECAAAAQSLTSLRAEEKSLAEAATRQAEIEKALSEIKAASSNIERLKADTIALEAELAEEPQMTIHMNRLNELDEIEKNLQQEQLDASKIEAANREARARAAGIQRQIDELKKRAEIVSRVPCSIDLGARCELLKDAIAAKDALPSLESELNQWECAVKPADFDPAPLNAVRAERAALRGKNIPARMERIRHARERLPMIAQQIESESSRLQALSAEQTLSLSKGSRSSEDPRMIAYNRARHIAVQNEIRAAAAKEALIPSIEEAKEALPALESSLDEAYQRSRDLINRRDDLSSRLAGLSDLSGALAKLRSDEAALKKQITDAEARIQALTKSIGAHEARIAELADLKASSEKIVEAHKITSAKRDNLSLLADAFGKKGVQPLLIEQARPHIEAISDDLLKQATDGRFSMRISTQKATKTAGVAETLDIVVHDGASERDVATFSGGEQKLLRTILRLALGIYQAQKSGKPFKLFCIDEAFDSLDPDNAQAMIGLLRALESHFDQILCVTHADNLIMDAPKVIRLSKSPAGVSII